MTDWTKHDGGPQPVADDVEIEVSYRRMLSPCKQVGAARFRNWKHNPEKPKGDIIRYRILNQHLIDAKQAEIDALKEDLAIWDSVFPDLLPDRLKSDKQLAEEDVAAKLDAARLEGIRLGLEAAAKVAGDYRNKLSASRLIAVGIHFSQHADDVLALDPETIAREAKPTA